MKKQTFLFFFLLFLSSCSTTDNEPEDRLEGYWASDPKISFYKYFHIEYNGQGSYPIMKSIDTLTHNDTLLLYVAEYNRSDYKPCPAKGNDLHFIIETFGGDIEQYTLSDDTSWFGSIDNITPYIKFLPFTFGQPKRLNNVIEINPDSDAIIATYSSYWHGHVVKDTLIYRKDTV